MVRPPKACLCSSCHPGMGTQTPGPTGGLAGQAVLCPDCGCGLRVQASCLARQPANRALVQLICCKLREPFERRPGTRHSSSGKARGGGPG